MKTTRDWSVTNGHILFFTIHTHRPQRFATNSMSNPIPIPRTCNDAHGQEEIRIRSQQKQLKYRYNIATWMLYETIMEARKNHPKIRLERDSLSSSIPKEECIVGIEEEREDSKQKIALIQSKGSTRQQNPKQPIREETKETFDELSEAPTDWVSDPFSCLFEMEW